MSGVQMNRRKVSAAPVKKMVIKPFKGAALQCVAVDTGCLAAQ